MSTPGENSSINQRPEQKAAPAPSDSADKGHAQDETRSNCLVDFYKSATNSAIGDPLRAVAQIADSGLSLVGVHADLDGKLKSGLSTLAIEKPKDAAYGTSNWYMQQLGGAVGMMVPFMGTRFGIGRIAGSALGEESALFKAFDEGKTFSSSTLQYAGREATLSAASGLVYGTALRTSDEQNVGTVNFLSDRFHQGTNDAVTFGLMGFANPFMSKAVGAAASIIEKPLATEGMFARLAPAQKVAAFAVRNPVSSGALSGLPGGFINAEMSARQRDSWVPTGEELKENLIGMSFIGGAFGGAHALFIAPRAVRTPERELPARTDSDQAEQRQHLVNLIAQRGRPARIDEPQVTPEQNATPRTSAHPDSDILNGKIAAMFGDNMSTVMTGEHADVLKSVIEKISPNQPMEELRSLGDWYMKNYINEDPETQIIPKGVRRVAKHWFDLEQPIRDLPLLKFMEQLGILENQMPKKEYGGFSGGGEGVTPKSAYAAINLGRGELARGELLTLEKALDQQALRLRGDRLKTLNGFGYDRPPMEELKRAVKTFEIDPLIPLELAKRDLKPWEIAALSMATAGFFRAGETDRDGDPRIIVGGIDKRFSNLVATGRDTILNDWNTSALVAAKETQPDLSDFEQHLIAAVATRIGEGSGGGQLVNKVNGRHFIDLFTPLDRGETIEHPLLSYAQENFDYRIPVDQWFDKSVVAESWPGMEMAFKLGTVFKDSSSDVVQNWLKSLQIEQWKKAAEEFPIGAALTNRHTETYLNRALRLPGSGKLPEVSEWFSKNPERTDEVRATIEQVTHDYMSIGYVDGLDAMQQLGFLTQDDLLDTKLRERARDGLTIKISETPLAFSQGVLEKTEFLFGDDARKDIVRPALSKALALYLERGVTGQVREIAKLDMLTDQDLKSDEVVNGARLGLLRQLSHGSADSGQSIVDLNILGEDDLKSPEVQKAARDGLLHLLGEGKTHDAVSLMKLGFLPETDMAAPEIHQAAYRGLMLQLKVGNISAVRNLVDLKALNREEVDKALRATADQGRITTAIRAALGEKIDFNKAMKRYLDIDKFDDAAAQSLFEKLQKQDSNWQDYENVSAPFEYGAEVFGAARMMRYALNAKVSPHDALHEFDNIVKLYERSGVSKDKFYGNILRQVGMDDAADDTGPSYQRLNVIARTFPEDINSVLEKTKQYPDIKTLQDLAAAFPDEQSVVASWTHLQRFSKLQHFVEQAELLPQLQQLRQEGNTKLADWVEALAFHPDSRVSTQAVIDFWKDPGKFIDYNDAHSGRSHELKKPSNYTDIPHLDMTPVELRDALVNGVLDRLQVFTPMKVEYKVGGDDGSFTSELSRALGSQRRRIPGEAKSPTKLFAEINAALKPSGLNVNKVLAGAEVPADVRTQVDKLLYDPIIGADQPKPGLRLVAEIHRKSDPLAVVAGDDTVSCMGFGTGKNNIYMFNPNDALFTVRLVRPDGSSRTIAQSVLTKDKDIKIPFPKVLEKFKEDEQTSLHSIIPEEALGREKAVIAADNVEVHPNYRLGDYPPALEAVYRDFFEKYIKEHGQDENLRGDKIVIGMGYSDAINELPKETNTFVPQAPVGYTDKTHDQVLSLSLKDPQKIPIEVLNVQNTAVENRVAPQGANRAGIAPLTFEDTLPVAYLEGKAFQDNSSLRVGLHKLENVLIAKDINNAAKGRPNLSLKYVDSDGKMKGYLLAYEGEGFDGETRKPMVFVSDLSSDRAVRADGTAKPGRVGGRLMYEFGEQYKQNYLDKGNMMPIFVNAREETSYKLIMDHLKYLGKKLGYDFEVKEIGEHHEGDSKMHDMVIVPIRKS